MAKIEYTDEERILIGRKLKHLMKGVITQTDLALQAFDKSRQAAQAHMKRILAGEFRKLTKDDIVKMLSIIDIEYDDFMDSPDPAKVNDSELLVNGHPLPKEFTEIWPDAPKYFRMLHEAQSANDERLESIIKIQMVESLRKQSAEYKKVAEEKEKELSLKKA